MYNDEQFITFYESVYDLKEEMHEKEQKIFLKNKEKLKRNTC